MNNEFHATLRSDNRRLNQWEKCYRAPAVVSSPLTIHLPTGTRCNLVCSFCTTRTGSDATPDYRDLSYTEFLRMVDRDDWKRLLQSASVIKLYGWGEPLFNPDYGKMVDFLRDRYPGLGISLSTNGTLFSKKWAEKFIDASSVNFSVNAATRSTYKNVMGLDLFDRVIENIRAFTALLQDCQGDNRPLVSMSFVATLENIRELPEFVSLAADLGADCASVADTMPLTPEIARLSIVNDPSAMNAALTAALEASRLRGIPLSLSVYNLGNLDSFSSASGAMYYRSQPPIKARRSPLMLLDARIPSPYAASTDCFEPWETMMLSISGDVYPCCEMASGGYRVMGNVNDHSFMDVWNGDAYRSLRATVNSETPPDFCAKCPRKLAAS